MKIDGLEIDQRLLEAPACPFGCDHGVELDDNDQVVYWHELDCPAGLVETVVGDNR